MSALCGSCEVRGESSPTRSTYKAGQLKLVLRKFNPNPVPVSLVHAGQGMVPAKVRCFMSFCKLKRRNVRIAMYGACCNYAWPAPLDRYDLRVVQPYGNWMTSSPVQENDEYLIVSRSSGTTISSARCSSNSATSNLR